MPSSRDTDSTCPFLSSCIDWELFILCTYRLQSVACCVVSAAGFTFETLRFVALYPFLCCDFVVDLTGDWVHDECTVRLAFGLRDFGGYPSHRSSR